MQPEGWILLIVFWGLIISLAVFCFRRILTKKEVK